MPLPDPDAVIDIIKETATSFILPRFQQLSDDDIREKSPGDLVTIADIESEQYLEQRLMELDPGSCCVGEEAAEQDPGVLKALSGEAPVWVLDPLDGTRNFASGRSPFAIIVAYCVDGETRMGWIHNPVTGQTVWAAAGQGAWTAAGQKLSVASGGDLETMKGSLSNPARDAVLGKAGAPTEITRVGCVGQDYMDVATGDLDFARYAMTLKPWDHAAGVLLHKEAGGYSCLVRSGIEYQPVLDPVIARSQEEILMMTPNREIWQQLSALTGDSTRVVSSYEK